MKEMWEWFLKFWNTHGERIAFAMAAVAFGLFFWFVLELKAQGETILIGVAMLFFNKARSPESQSITLEGGNNEDIETTDTADK